jgi:hypothetical protein
VTEYSNPRLRAVWRLLDAVERRLAAEPQLSWDMALAEMLAGRPWITRPTK